MSMRARSLFPLLIIVATALTVVQAQTVSLASPDQLKPLNVKAETVTFKGRKALRVRDTAPPELGDEGRFVILPKTDFQDGVIEVDLAGVFEISGFVNEQLRQMLGSFCPNILFPYAREVISDLVVRGGFPQLLLAPVNFDALYAQHTEDQKKSDKSLDSKDGKDGDTKVH